MKTLLLFSLLFIFGTLNKITAQVNGPINICQGTTYNYQTAFSSAYSWSVTGGSATIATPSAQTTDITFNDPIGSYTVTSVTISPNATFTVIVTNDTPPAPTANGSTTCAGNTALPTTNGVGTLSWFNTPTGGTSFFTGGMYNTPALFTTTTYYIEDVLGGCPSLTRTPVTITVNPLPTITVNSPTLCSGQSSLLTASGASTYNWAPPIGLSATTGSNVVTTPSSSTAYTVTGSNGGCTSNAISNVIVNPLPTIIAPSVTNACIGSNTTLTATGATTYTWSPGGFLTPSINVSPLVSTSYTVTGAAPTGCINTATSLVVVNADKNITGIASSTFGTLTADAYLLRYNAIQLAFDTIQTIPLSSNAYNFNTVAAGTYLLKVVADTGNFPLIVPTYYGDKFQWDSAVVINHGCLADFTANITMIEIPTNTGSGFISGHLIEDPGFGLRIGNNHNQILAPGGPLKGIDVKLGKNPGGGIQARTMSDTTGYYEFTNIPADTFTIYIDIPGLPMDSSYHVTIAAGAETFTGLNYFADSNSVYPLFVAVGLPQANTIENNMNVFPNPAKQNLQIRFSAISETAKIELYNPQGIILYTQELKGLTKGEQELQLNLDKMKITSGIYFLRVSSNNTNTTKKIIVTE